MAPGGRSRGREVQYPHDLGKVGRRTGMTIPDSGVRDENGLEPMDHLFSSPEKAAPVVNGNGKAASKMLDMTNSSEEDMDVVDSTTSDPTRILSNQARASLRPPRSVSPRKTFLQSPARHNPSMGRGSSVDDIEPVVRQLDFSNGENFNPNSRRAPSIEQPKPMGKPNGIGSANKLKRPYSFEEEEEESIAPVGGGVDYEDTDDFQGVNADDEVPADDDVDMDRGLAGDENGFDNDDGEQNDEDQDVAEKEQEPVKAPAKGRSRPGKSKSGDPSSQLAFELNGGRGRVNKSKTAEPPAQPAQEVNGGRGRPAKSKAAEPSAQLENGNGGRGRAAKSKAAEHPAQPAQEEIEGGQSKKRGRPGKTKAAEEEAQEVPAEEEEAAPVDDDDEEIVTHKRKKRKISPPVAEQPKRGKGHSAAIDPEAPKVSKATRVKKVKAPQPGASPPAEIIRAPPRPNTQGGLVILRREDTNGLTQTRSGRHSFKPLATWRNERVVYEESEIADYKPGNYDIIAKQSIAEIVRIDEAESQQKRSRARPKSASSKSSKKRQVESDDEDDDAEAWELEPGRIVGDVRVWSADDPTSAYTEDTPEEIALSSAAIITREIPGSTFKFAKTLTLPFFGSGMVDIPVGGMKKPKNSRKMHMCFFVFYGRVKVTVNDNEFRIGKGGLWQVPRGNFYSIENDYDKPARIFFSQGCEVSEAIAEE